MKKLLLHSLLILLVLPYAAKATDYDRSKMDINPSIDPARKCADLIGKLNLPDFEAVGGATLIHSGRISRVWNVDIFSEQEGKLVSTARVLYCVLKKK